MRSTYNLLQAARETGALKEAKDKLEKHVEELTWRLQLEKRLRVILMLRILLIGSFRYTRILLISIVCFFYEKFTP